MKVPTSNVGREPKCVLHTHLAGFPQKTPVSRFVLVSARWSLPAHACTVPHAPSRHRRPMAAMVRGGRLTSFRPRQPLRLGVGGRVGGRRAVGGRDGGGEGVGPAHARYKRWDATVSVARLRSARVPRSSSEAARGDAVGGWPSSLPLSTADFSRSRRGGPHFFPPRGTLPPSLPPSPPLPAALPP